jgi:hypothetical protein
MKETRLSLSKAGRLTRYLILGLVLAGIIPLLKCGETKKTGMGDIAATETSYWYLWSASRSGTTSGPSFLTVLQVGYQIYCSHSCYSGDPWLTGAIKDDRFTLSYDFGGEDPGNRGTVEGSMFEPGKMQGTYSDGVFWMEQSGEHICDPEMEGVVLGVYYPESLTEATASRSSFKPQATTQVDCATAIDESAGLPQGTEIDQPKKDTEPEETETEGENFPAVQCTRQPYVESKNRQISDELIMATSSAIYPGSLIQGGKLVNPTNPQIVEITQPARSGGKISLSEHLALKPGCQYSATLDSISYSNVNQARMDLLNCGVEGTAAELKYESLETFSSQQLSFELNTEVNFVDIGIKNDLSVDQTTNTNSVVLYFRQVFYRLSFEPPTSPESVFASPSCNPNMLGGNNPPLYVSDVKYGRLIFFSVESEYSSEDIQESIEAAASGAAASGKCSSGMTFQNVMSSSRIRYTVYGGGAKYATGPIAASSPSQMYDKVKNMIADENASVYSPANPGLPISFSLNYLKDNSPAIKNFSVEYDLKSCHPKSDWYTFKMKAVDVDDDMYFYRGGKEKKHIKLGKSGTYEYSNSECFQDECEQRIKYSLWNGGCLESGAEMQLLRNGSKVWKKKYDHPGWALCQELYYAVIDINTFTGKWKKIEAVGYEGTKWKEKDW